MISCAYSCAVRHLPRQFGGNGLFSKAKMSMPVKMPSLSPTMTSGTIVRWAKQAGEQVDPGDVICEIQTDKAVVAMEFDEEGVLAKILVPEGTADVEVGFHIAVVAEPGENWEEVASKAVTSAKDVAKPESARPPTSPPVSPPSSSGVVAPSPAVQARSGGADHHFDPHLTGKAGPSVRLLLHLYEIDASRIESSGYRGTMLKSDVMNYITQQGLKPKEQSSPPPALPAKVSTSPPPAAAKVSKSIPKQPVGKPSPVGEYTDYPLAPEDMEAGKRILASKLSIPHAFCTVEVNATRLMQLIDSLTDKQLKMRLGDFVVKACSLSLQVVPDMNVLYDSSQDSLIHTNSVVLTETVRSHSDRAFGYPLLTSVDRGVAFVSKERKELMDRLEKGNDVNSFGSVISVYDLSETGVRECSSVVDSSQTGVVAIGAPHPFVDPENSDAVSQIISITLCFDNRAVDESVAARYMDAVKSMMEDPELFIAGVVPGGLDAEVGGSRDESVDLDEVPVDLHKSSRTLASLL